jgi:hypothetical protein
LALFHLACEMTYVFACVTQVMYELFSVRQ